MGVSPLGKSNYNLMLNEDCDDFWLVLGTAGFESGRRGSNQSDTSALVSSLTRDLSQSPSQSTQPKGMTPSPSGSSLQTSPGNIKKEVAVS